MTPPENRHAFQPPHTDCGHPSRENRAASDVRSSNEYEALRCLVPPLQCLAMSAALHDPPITGDRGASMKTRLHNDPSSINKCQASSCVVSHSQRIPMPAFVENRSPSYTTSSDECEASRCVGSPLQCIAMSVALHDIPKTSREPCTENVCPGRNEEADEQDSLQLPSPADMRQERLEDHLIPDFSPFSLSYVENTIPLGGAENEVPCENTEGLPALSIANSPLYLAAIPNPLHLQVRSTSDEDLVSASALAVRSIIDFSGDKRVWALNVEDVCRTECCMMRKLWNLGTFWEGDPRRDKCRELHWEWSKWAYVVGCKHKSPAIRFFDRLGPAYKDRIHSICLQTNKAAFLDPYQVSSAVDVILRTFPNLEHAQIVLHPASEGEIRCKGKITFLARIFRKLENHLPDTERLKVRGLDQHPELERRWIKRRRGWYMRGAWLSMTEVSIRD